MKHTFTGKPAPSYAILVPADVTIVQPPADMPRHMAAFFGRSGVWRGMWRSPQVKGGYEALLIVSRMVTTCDTTTADIVYVTADYPPWYVSALRYDITAAFTSASDGKLVLRVPYSPAATTIDLWMEGITMKGMMYGRYMRCDISFSSQVS